MNAVVSIFISDIIKLYWAQFLIVPSHYPFYPNIIHDVI